MLKQSQSELETLQSQFISALQHPSAMGSCASGLAIKGNSRMSATDCLAIYQRSYYSRLLVCMREQFPALCHCLGEALFDDFSKEYLAACKPSSYTLYKLGQRFPKFLFDTRPNQNVEDQSQETWIRFMLELAEFECRAFSLFDAHGEEEHAMASLDTQDDDLALQACFTLGAYQFDVASYYHGVRNHDAPDLPPVEPTKIALVRKDYLTHTLFLSEPHYYFLLAMTQGSTVNDALRQVAEHFSLPFDQVVSSWQDPNGIRARWINSGVFLNSRR